MEESDLAKVNISVINGKEIIPEVKAKIEGAKASYEMTSIMKVKMKNKN